MFSNFWLCASVFIISAAATYIFLGPSDRSKRKGKAALHGLQNLGNTCFLNAVLQALVACPSCVSWLSIIAASFNQETCPLINAVLDVFKGLRGQADSCSAAQVMDALRVHRWLISNEEQDAHELFHILTTTIEEELCAADPVLSLFDAAKLSEEERRAPFTSSSKHLTLKSPTRGLLASELKCNSCHSKYPTRYDTFNSISLAIPMPHWGELSLQDLLQKFISCELIQDVSCDVCSRKTQDNVCIPKCKTAFLKQLSFGKLPKCLCIHIQRTIWLSNGLPLKCHDHILFPEILVMDHYVHWNFKSRRWRDDVVHIQNPNGKTQVGEGISFPAKASTDVKNSFTSYVLANCTGVKQLFTCNFVFLLQAIIVHLGDTSSGHFITYRRGTDLNRYKWFRISDSTVSEVPFTEVSQSCAYMLFYEKIN